MDNNSRHLLRLSTFLLAAPLWRESKSTCQLRVYVGRSLSEWSSRMRGEIESPSSQQFMYDRTSDTTWNCPLKLYLVQHLSPGLISFLWAVMGPLIFFMCTAM